MPNDLPVPPELQDLIEKRETDDQRKKERRSGQDRRTCDLGPMGAIESLQDLEQVPATERRCGQQRRKTEDRRKGPRRKTGVEPQLPDPPE